MKIIELSQKNNIKPICVFSCLAFGDLLIDCHFLKNVPDVVIITPFYNKEFCEMLNPTNKIEYFNINKNQIPPLLFNFKSHNYWGIIKSWFELRKIVKKISKKYTIIYNTDSIRWRSLNIFSKFYYLRRKGQNIYEEYATLVNSNEILLKKKGISNIIYIFPDSRQNRRTIPTELLISICFLLKEKSLEYRVITNRTDERIENKMPISSLIELFHLIKISGFVISAESMPIHLSEYFSKENFLIAPAFNYELFPKTIIDNNNWSTYFDLTNFRSWLNRIAE
jgi:ADP-heptose:LPS heptosyltransferase